MKAAQKGIGSIQKAWLVIGKEMETDGQAHRCIANSLEDDIVKPLKNLQETHCRIKKTVECNVSKTSKYNGEVNSKYAYRYSNMGNKLLNNYL